ncbi:MAG TPA: ArgR family transcriptional regulator [Gammaproteobacteria bacterium]|jgi:transcriptional regulator of arginine metabolism|nr:ArgR family transcriptional regulator [Gammaproteobacteria bacterium]
MTDQTHDLLSTLKSILQTGSAHTQEDIIAALRKRGFDVNQSKISRLLRKIGAVKMANESGQIIYTLPRDPAPISAKHILSYLVMDVLHNESLIIIYTNPGSASVIARLMDHKMKELGIIGTVAGDDTIFAAPHSIKHIARIAKSIKDYLNDIR